jgi:hypothetical protein
MTTRSCWTASSVFSPLGRSRAEGDWHLGPWASLGAFWATDAIWSIETGASSLRFSAPQQRGRSRRAQQRVKCDSHEAAGYSIRHWIIGCRRSNRELSGARDRTGLSSICARFSAPWFHAVYTAHAASSPDWLVLSVLASKIQTWSHMASASRARRDCSGSSRIVVRTLRQPSGEAGARSTIFSARRWTPAHGAWP